MLTILFTGKYIMVNINMIKIVAKQGIGKWNTKLTVSMESNKFAIINAK